jgi:hypothetical protein
MIMPLKFFDDYYKWKIDMEKEKIQRQKSEIDTQKKLNAKIKGESHLKNTRQRLYREKG